MIFLTLLKSLGDKLKKLSLEDFFLCAAIIVIIFLAIRNHHAANQINTVPPTIQLVQNKVDKKGTDYTEIKQVLYTQDQVNHMTDSLRKVLGKSKVDGVTVVTSNLQGQLKTDSKTFYIDTGKHTIFDSYRDKGIYMEYSGNFDTHYGLFKFGFTPDTAMYITTSKNHWFKPNEYSIDIYHTNSYFTKATIGGSSYTFKEARPWLTIGPSVGVNIGFSNSKFSFNPMVGITATYPIIILRNKKK